jgi:hypothetical protein
MSNNQGILKYKNIEPKNFVTSELKKNTNQDFAFVNYMIRDRSTRPLIQTPWVHLKTYGIPQEGLENYKTELSRAFLKFPLNTEVDKKGEDATSDEKQFAKKFQELDKYFESAEFKNKVFGGAVKAKKYTYSSIVKAPMELEEPDDDADQDEIEKYKKQKQQYRPLSMKAKFSVELDDADYKDKKIKNILTSVRVRKDDGTKEKVKVQSLEDLEKYVRYGSQVRMILAPSKLWAAKSPLPGSANKLYGVQFKILQIEVIPGKGQEKVNVEEDLMISDSDDDNENEKRNNYVSDSDDTDDSDDESD